jgi:hypothetical protein
MHKRLNKDEFSQIKQVAERARPMAVPNEQIKQRSNFESSAKLRLIVSKSALLRDEIRPPMDASPITIFSIPEQFFRAFQSSIIPCVYFIKEAKIKMSAACYFFCRTFRPSFVGIIPTSGIHETALFSSSPPSMERTELHQLLHEPAW